MLRLGRRYRFSASHRLHSPELSEQENRDIFGKCNNPFGHGHDYVLEVIFKGEPDAETGLLIDLPAVDRTIREQVLAGFDHKYLNEEIDAFREIPPTTENVAVEITRRLREVFPGGRYELDGVLILETKRNSVLLEIR